MWLGSLLAARIDGHDVAVASFKDAIRAGKDAAAAKDPDGYGRIRAIEIAAKQAFPDDKDMDARFDLRNQLRAEQGLPPEKRKRGGFAGAYDKGFLAPALAIGLGPLALGLAGGGAGAAGGTAASTAGTAGTVGTAGTAASGGLAPIAATGGGLGGGGFSLGGLASQAGNFLKDPKNLMKLGSGIYGITQQQKGAGQMNQALADDRARWAAGAPLREQGRAQMLAPMPVDTSSLDALAGQGNPFAKPRAVPPIPLGGR